MTSRRFLVSFALFFLFALPATGGELPMVNESARAIPVAYEVDVLVVGGGTGAVQAAVAAAEAGANVFLAAPILTWATT